MEIFTENPMIIVAIVIFIICVVIGFFGDQHFKKKKELERIINDNEKNNSNINNDQPSGDEVSGELAGIVENQKNINGSDSISSINDGVIQTNLENSTQDNSINDAIESSLSNINAQVNNESKQQWNNNSLPENNINEPTGNPVPFDGQINNEENINNMF